MNTIAHTSTIIATKHSLPGIPDGLEPAAPCNAVRQPGFVADSLGRDYRTPCLGALDNMNIHDMDELLRGLSARERRDLSTLLAQFSPTHHDAQNGLRLLGATFAALEGMRIEDWPAVSATLREALATGEYRANRPLPPVATATVSTTTTVIIHFDALEELFLQMMNMQINVGRSASSLYLKALDNMVAAAKRKGAAIEKEARVNFGFAIAGAVVSGGLSIGGAVMKIKAANKSLNAHRCYNGTSASPKNTDTEAGSKYTTTLTTKSNDSLVGNKGALQETLSHAKKLAVFGDLADGVGRPLGQVTQASGEMFASTYKREQNDATTEQTVFEALRSDERERIGKAIQAITSFQSDFRTYIEKRANALDSTSSARLA